MTPELIQFMSYEALSEAIGAHSLLAFSSDKSQWAAAVLTAQGPAIATYSDGTLSVDKYKSTLTAEDLAPMQSEPEAASAEAEPATLAQQTDSADDLMEVLLGWRVDASDDDKILMAVAKIIYGGFDNWEVRGVRNLRVGTPESGLTVEVIILSEDGEVLRLECTWDGEQWVDRLMSEDKSDALRLDAPKKGGGARATPKCKAGRPCGKACISKAKTCRVNPTGAVKEALDRVAGGGGGETPKSTAKKPKAKAKTAAGAGTAPGPAVTIATAKGSDYFAKEIAELKERRANAPNLDREIAEARKAADAQRQKLKDATAKNANIKMTEFGKLAELDSKVGDLMRQKSQPARDVEAKILERAREYVEAKRAGNPATQFMRHGMIAPQNMTPITFDGLTIYDSPENQAKTIAGFMASPAWGSSEVNYLNTKTREIFLANGPNKEDAYWAEKFNSSDFVSNATGGDGNIVVYGGKRLQPSTYYHEGGHNLATAVYGDPTPPPGSDFEKIRTTAPTLYGQSSRAEDFAESVMLHIMKKYGDTRSESLDPQRQRVMERLFSDPNYGG